ncbi:lysophospholipid acyltransferase family protein [Saxibacter everestensis]|uniref:Lysophospholipid acyltransferase family protein n=1 Tax=Saxibacter everestensis TaxID=2909229 RepID=A0ABY8QXU6_9MICO|nr:lysophospholipid acyltransferase family protein [Brevibacteriaceae bacterium ZFBP1038]
MFRPAAAEELARAGAPHRWRLVGRILMSPWRRKVHLAEKLPAAGGVIVVANHLTYLDGPLVYRISPRPMHLLVRHDIFKGIVGWALKSSGQIPIDRASNDRNALGTALRVLRRGDVLGIFPEGTRGEGSASSVRSGAAWLALQAEVPIVPVAVLGTRRGGEPSRFLPPPGRKIDIVFGDPVYLEKPAGQSGRAARLAASKQLQAILANHVRQSLQLTGQTLPSVAQADMVASSTPNGDANF